MRLGREPLHPLRGRISPWGRGRVRGLGSRIQGAPICLQSVALTYFIVPNRGEAGP